MAKIRVKNTTTPALLCNRTVPRADRQDFRITVESNILEVYNSAMALQLNSYEG